MMIDTHCHLLKEDYPNRDEIIKHMGSNIMISSGATMKDNESTLELISTYSNIYGTLVLHLDESENYDLDWLEKHVKDDKIVGIGEIGLDYYHDTDREKQKELFIKQLDLASKYNLPVVIHSRDAAEDTYNILSNYPQ